MATNTDRIHELMLSVARLEERHAFNADNTTRVRELELKLTELATQFKEFREANQDRRKNLLAWIAIAVAVIGTAANILYNFVFRHT